MPSSTRPPRRTSRTPPVEYPNNLSAARACSPESAFFFAPENILDRNEPPFSPFSPASAGAGAASAAASATTAPVDGSAAGSVGAICAGAVSAGAPGTVSDRNESTFGAATRIVRNDPANTTLNTQPSSSRNQYGRAWRRSRR